METLCADSPDNILKLTKLLQHLPHSHEMFRVLENFLLLMRARILLVLRNGQNTEHTPPEKGYFNNPAVFLKLYVQRVTTGPIIYKQGPNRQAR